MQQPARTASSLPGRSAALQRALLLTAVAAGLSIPLSLFLHLVAPDLDSIAQRFIAVLVMAALALAATTTTDPGLFGWKVRTPRLLLLPAVLAVLPLFGGVKSLEMPVLTMIIVGEMATGVFEEFWFRGLTLRALQGWRPLPAALLSSALFALTHLANIAYGADPAITAAQVVGAFTFGVGYAALRMRTGGLWALVILHALTDIALAIGDVPGGLRWGIMIGSDTVLLVLGIYLLRRTQTVTVRDLLTGRAPAISARPAATGLMSRR
jgi:hypothetical protein